MTSKEKAIGSKQACLQCSKCSHHCQRHLGQRACRHLHTWSCLELFLLPVLHQLNRQPSVVRPMQRCFQKDLCQDSNMQMDLEGEATCQQILLWVILAHHEWSKRKIGIVAFFAACKAFTSCCRLQNHLKVPLIIVTGATDGEKDKNNLETFEQ